MINGQKISRCRICEVGQVDWNSETQTRSGVIIATRRPNSNSLLYGLAIDRKHKEYTDFGGGREKNDKNPLNCGLREFKEESLNQFVLHPDDVKKSLAYITSNMVFIIYLVSWEKICRFKKTFDILANLGTWTENSGFSILNYSEMKLLLNNEPVNGIVMYNKVIDELNKGFELLNIMLNSYI